MPGAGKTRPAKPPKGAAQKKDQFESTVSQPKPREIRPENAEISALLQSAEAVLKLKDFREVARSIFDSCKSLIGATAGYVALLAEDGATTEVVSLDAGDRPCSVDPSLPMPARGLREQVFFTGRPVCQNDFQGSGGTRYLPEGHVALDNVLFVPLTIDGEALGVLGFANKEGGFSDEDVRTASVFGEMAAIALANKRDVESLQNSEERFRSVAQSASDAIVCCNQHGSITFWNKAAQRIFGYPATEVMGKPVTTIIPERFRKAHAKALARLVSSGKSSSMGKTMELAGLRMDGTEFPVELSLARWKVGDSPFFTGIIRDITDRKGAEEALRKSEERYRTMIEHSNDLIWTLDKHCRFTYWNGRLEEVSGHSLGDWMGRDCGDLVPQDDLPRLRGVYCTVLDGKPLHHELTIVSKGGSCFVLSVNTAPIFEAGEITGTVSFGRDITEQKRAEEALQASERRFRLMAENAWDIIHRIRLSPEFAVEYMSPSVAAIAGYAPEEFYADSELVFKIVHPDDRPVLKSALKSPESFETKPVILRWRRKDGRLIWTEHRGIMVRDEAASVVAIESIARDITLQRRAEEQIRYLSFHDKLTGLYNRAYFEEELRRLDTKRQLPLSLILGDLNGLKLVNDAFGHHEGDKLLARIAGIIRDACRKEDIVARWGGDEFAILLPRTNQEDALEVRERIRNICREVEEGPVQPSIALGVATKLTPHQPMREVLKEAEDWMYRRKLVESESTRGSIIASLQKTLSERTHETDEHARRLRELAVAVGRLVGLSDADLDKLSLFAVLHDIGKVAIPDDALAKPSALSFREWEALKKHSEIGYRIAQSSLELAHIAEEILTHHEWWNGKGYPRGLKGEDIPLLSRILAIVDAYDVMTHGRSYKKPVSRETALEELRRRAGSQFDPKLVKLFLKMMSASPEPRMDLQGGGIP